MSENLWLEDEPSNRHTRSHRRQLAVILAATICLAVIAAPVAIIVFGGSGSRSAGPRSTDPAQVGNGKAAPQVLSALNATTATGNFDVSYTFGGQPGGQSTTTTTTNCAVPVAGASSGAVPSNCVGGPQPGGQPVAGNATIDINPFAMVASSQVSGFGTIVLRDNGTDVWEQGGGNYGLSPGVSGSGPGSPLTGFASLVEGTLGPRQGALAMLGLASPTGYLNLDPAETSTANLVGTDTVSGVPVSVYQISQTPADGSQTPGLTSQEQQAVADAMQVLSSQGYTGSTVRVSVDGAGFIRRTQTTDHFADGTTMTSEAEFSNFGCAGTVLMPGQSGSDTPPTGCTSPDNPTAATTSTTTTTIPAPTTTSPTTTTALPTSPSTGTPPSSTTTTANSKIAPS